MGKLWQIAKYEYKRHVFRKRFIWALLSMPLMIVLIILITVLMGLFMTNRSPVGYLDHSGILKNPISIGNSKNIFEPGLDMRPFTSEATARQALEDKDIQMLFIIPENYPQNREVPLYYYGQPDDNAQYQSFLFIRENLLAGEFIPNMDRINQGTTFTLQSQDGSKDFQENQWYNILTPLLVGVLFLIVVMTSGGYLLQAVVEEKENRTMEIVITSVSPMQLMAGKIIGNISVGLTQLMIWLVFSWLSLVIARQFIPFLSLLDISGIMLLKPLLIILPAFVSIAAMMAALGATVTESREAQQMSGLFTLPIILPVWFITPIMLNPDGPIALFLSYFPLSAPITLAIREAFTVIPTWEWVLIVTIQVSFALFMMWVAARVFRLGMLQYGKRLTLKQIFRKEARNA